LLQLLIEELTREGFADYLRAAVLQPLGMAASDFAVTRSHAAVGHAADGRALPWFRFDGRAAAGLATTITDLGRFAAAQLAGGRGVVSPASLALMTGPVAATGGADGLWPRYGLGYEIDDRGGAIVVGHHGANRGWRALLALCPARAAALAVLVNSDRGTALIDPLYAQWRATL
jgi:CubicO group peptidase (beta-lactamase class C family)